MAMTPEAKVKKAVVAILKELGIFYFFPAANGYGTAGVSDIICCADSLFIAIECKAGRGKTTALQDRFIANVRSVGGTAIVVNETNIADMKEELLCLLAKKK